MKSRFARNRVLAAIAAVGIVAGTIAGLGSYSNAKYAVVAAAAHRPDATFAQRAIEPSRIDVVATRGARARTIAQAIEAGQRLKSL